MITHKLKISPIYFERVWSEEKTFEIRNNDRDFQKGDAIELLEWDGNKYTGRSACGRIDYVLSNFSGLKDGFAVFSIKITDFVS